MKIDPIYYVYVIINIVTNKIYVGSHICRTTNDVYMGSSRHLNEDYILYGKNNFTKTILKYYVNKDEMVDGEIEYINKLNSLVPNGYNRHIPKGGFYAGMTGCHHSIQSKQKISNKLSGENNPMYGIEWSEEKKDKMRGSNNGMFGKIPANKGKQHSQETRDKIRQKTKEAMHKAENWNKFITNNKEGKLNKKLKTLQNI